LETEGEGCPEEEAITWGVDMTGYKGNWPIGGRGQDEEQRIKVDV